MPVKWMTLKQIAAHLQASKEKVYKLCQRGRIPASKIGGNWLFDIKEVDRWAKQQRPRKKWTRKKTKK